MDGLTRRINVCLSVGIAFFMAVCIASTGCFTTHGNEASHGEPVRASAPGSAVHSSPAEISPARPIPNASDVDTTAQHTETLVSGTPSSAEITPPDVSDSRSTVTSERFPVTVPRDNEARRNIPGAAPVEPSAAGTGSKVVPTPLNRSQVRSDIRVPQWVLRQETLSFRVDFLGISVGYASFQCSGMVSVEGRAAYHIKVKAWTSGFLSYVYPISEAIEYYLDAETIQPIRIEYIGKKDKRDDVAIYDQKNGKIVYLYLDDGTIRKTVDTVPSCYDPVSAVYYFRSRDIGRESKPVNLYAGRKIYQIAGRSTGSERLKTKSGLVETLVIEPVIWREGKPYDKGEFRMWVTNDDRRVPVRIFGKFRKIKDWTLVGELIPEQTED